jgi:hypothetical protein
MIDHVVIINNKDVSKHVISINIEQSIETDSDPGKITVVLANVDSQYTTQFVPQAHTIEVYLYNFVYSSPVGGIVATGKVTDTVCPKGDEVTVKGECDLGHLADYLPKDYDIKSTTCKTILEEILKLHDTPIILDFEVIDRDIKPVTYNGDWTYQAVLEDIRQITGAVYYFDEHNKLKFRDPRQVTSVINLDPFVSNPTQAKSIMGFCNYVDVICYMSDEDTAESFSTPGHMTFLGHYQDDDDIEKHKKLIAPIRYFYNVHDKDEANKIAEQVYEFYKLRRDSLTEITVEGICPPLQSIVSYTAFQKIDDPEVVPVKLYGLVIEKKVDYSSNGFTTTIALHPRASMEEVIDDISALLGEQFDAGDNAPDQLTDAASNPIGDFLSWLGSQFDFSEVTWGQ